MGKLQIDLKIPTLSVKQIYPTSCTDCPFFTELSVDWCGFYNKRIGDAYNKPEWCKVTKISVEE